MAIGNTDARPNIRGFYERFHAERSIFASAMHGMSDAADRESYATLMLTRMMFLYFLRHNGLLVCKHYALERDNAASEISDEAFARICAFFDTYQWQLDEDAPHTKDTITPATLSYLFERHTNRKQTGTYYTREDITTYIAASTIIPYLFGALHKRCAVAFMPGALTWQLLRDNPHRYIYPALAHGNSLPLPGESARGLRTGSRRKGWDQPAPTTYALPGETWREVVARRQRYHELLAKLQEGEINAIDDLITYNLDLRRYALDIIEKCQDIDLLRALYEIMSSMTIFDPTCGTGAFLLAALNVLEPLHMACLSRLEQLQVGIVESDAVKLTERSYAIRKAIISSNLYGMDILGEAVELCKARLHLKLLSCVKAPLELESLPDLDQHIRSGNILIEAGEERGAFSVVIGNPPYIEYEKVSSIYRLEGYKTLATGNLYA